MGQGPLWDPMVPIHSVCPGRGAGVELSGREPVCPSPGRPTRDRRNILSSVHLRIKTTNGRRTPSLGRSLASLLMLSSDRSSGDRGPDLQVDDCLMARCTRDPAHARASAIAVRFVLVLFSPGPSGRLPVVFVDLPWTHPQSDCETLVAESGRRAMRSQCCHCCCCGVCDWGQIRRSGGSGAPPASSSAGPGCVDMRRRVLTLEFADDACPQLRRGAPV